MPSAGIRSTTGTAATGVCGSGQASKLFNQTRIPDATTEPNCSNAVRDTRPTLPADGPRLRVGRMCFLNVAGLREHTEYVPSAFSNAPRISEIRSSIRRLTPTDVVFARAHRIVTAASLNLNSLLVEEVDAAPITRATDCAVLRPYSFAAAPLSRDCISQYFTGRRIGTDSLTAWPPDCHVQIGPKR
jgi:hypothetical protein